MSTCSAEYGRLWISRIDESLAGVWLSLMSDEVEKLDSVPQWLATRREQWRSGALVASALFELDFTALTDSLQRDLMLQLIDQVDRRLDAYPEGKIPLSELEGKIGKGIVRWTDPLDINEVKKLNRSIAKLLNQDTSPEPGAYPVDKVRTPTE